MANRDSISTLSKYLADYPNDYSVFGGLATSLVLSQQGLSFRETHDADIMVVAKVSGGGFAKALSALLSGGGSIYRSYKIDVPFSDILSSYKTLFL